MDIRHYIKPVLTALTVLILALAQNAFAEESESASEEPLELIVSAPRTANQEPAGSMSTIVSSFRYDPQVELQDRNLAEAQSDITIRGGTFDMTGISIGAAPIYDPQTGHYTAEIPIPTAFLTSPQVLTGAENALSSFNATAGSIQTSFSAIEDWSTIKSGIGDHRTNIQEATVERANVLKTDIGSIGFSSNFAHSTSDGSREDGDSEFFRYAARAQLYKGLDRQTDLAYGYQSKDFSWPNLYALQELHDLVGSSGVESEKLDTAMVILNHRQKISETGELEFTSYYRRNHDDYEFDRYNKDLFNPFRHTTKVYGAGTQILEHFGDNYIGGNATVFGDEIDSTALVFGNYDSRTLAKVSSYVGRNIALDDNWILDPYAGLSWDKSDRTSEAVSPIAKISLTKKGSDAQHQFYTEYSTATQLPGYTALNSNPTGGLFKGNKSLKRQESKNTEVGYEFQSSSLFLSTALFTRDDDDLTDWTYTSGVVPFAARTANNVDIETRGLEVFGALTKWDYTLSGGYTLLDKHSDYEQDGIDASFYALNYPGHRVTTSLIARPIQMLELRGDLEFRKQYQNELRMTDDTSYIISSVSGTIAVPGVDGLSLALIVDNIGNELFEEVPGVPGSGRYTSAVANYVW
jgi:vitamin B12 transporter